jgi:putative ABC transport system permease protein
MAVLYKTGIMDRAADIMFSEAIRSAIQNIRAHRLRSALTMIGILMGTAAIIAVLSTLQGLNEAIKERFESLGGDVLTLVGVDREGQRAKIGVDEMHVLRFDVPDIAIVAANMFIPGRPSYGGRESNDTVNAMTPDFARVHGIHVSSGRDLTDADERERRRVVVIGPTVVESLQLPTDPRGEFIQIQSQWFEIVGVLPKRGRLSGFSYDEVLYIPFATGEAMVPQNLGRVAVHFKVASIEAVEEVRNTAQRAIRSSRGLRSAEADDFRIEAVDSFLEEYRRIARIATAALIGVVSISLLVGGVGVMNIMLMSVTERTREIGILKALGAKRRVIRRQFLLEAIMLSLMGGVVGIVAGVSISDLVASNIPDFPQPYLPWWGLLGAAAFSTLVGIIFGLAPAIKASNLDPIEALRYE